MLEKREQGAHWADLGLWWGAEEDHVDVWGLLKVLAFILGVTEECKQRNEMV